MKPTTMNMQIQSIKELFNNISDTLSRDEINKIRRNIYKKEYVYNILRKKDKLKSKESKILNNIIAYLNKLHDDLLKQNKYQENMYALDLLFNDDDYYKPVEVKSAFDGNYELYESNGDEKGLLSIPEYFLKIKPYLRDLIDFFNTLGEWKMQLSMHIKFISFTDTTERQIMHSKSGNVETMRGIDADETIKELIDSFMKRYQEGLETKMKGSSYTFKCIESLEYHFHRVTLNRGSSYIPSLEWPINKKTINSKNTKDNKCSQYAITATLNYQNIGNNPQRITNLIPFIANYNWNDINFPAGHQDNSAFEKNNSNIVINILFIPHKTQEIRQAYISKHNKN